MKNTLLLIILLVVFRKKEIIFLANQRIVCYLLAIPPAWAGRSESQLVMLQCKSCWDPVTDLFLSSFSLCCTVLCQWKVSVLTWKWEHKWDLLSSCKGHDGGEANENRYIPHVTNSHPIVIALWSLNMHLYRKKIFLSRLG